MPAKTGKATKCFGFWMNNSALSQNLPDIQFETDFDSSEVISLIQNKEALLRTSTGQKSFAYRVDLLQVSLAAKTGGFFRERLVASPLTEGLRSGVT